MKPDGYWKDWENVKRELEEVINELGYFPSFNELVKMGKSSLTTGIKNFGGAFKVRELLGYKSPSIPHGTWKSLEFTIKQAEEAMKKEGWDKLPQYRVLKKNGYSSLGAAISHYHGGFYKFRKALNEISSRFPPNARQDLDFLINYARNIMQQNNWEELPSSDYLQKNGYANLVHSICTFHGGMGDFRKLLGQNIKQVKKGQWQDLEFTLEMTRNVMKEHSWNELPSHSILIRAGYSNLTNAIRRYHGGFHRFRELLGEKQLVVKKGSWQDLEFCIAQAKIFMKEYGFDILPSQRKLYELGYSSLSTAITTYHGGYSTFRETLKQHMTGKSTKQELEDLLESYAGED